MKKQVSIYERLPEIYRTKDSEQNPPYQLKNYLELVENIYSEIHNNIEKLYNDFFIENCSDWAIPYIGDLFGKSYLKGESTTLRADIYDTISLNRRKGTLGALEQLVFDLTRWGVHGVELRENLLWNQNLNHQRPFDVKSPFKFPLFSHVQKTGTFNVSQMTEKQAKNVCRVGAIRGGTVNIRDPSMLSLLKTPFDPYGYSPDFRIPEFGRLQYNIPNLAIFLWRLQAYTVKTTKPGVITKVPLVSGNHYVRIQIHPLMDTSTLGRHVILFNKHSPNTNTNELDQELIDSVATLDQTPNPIPVSRLTQDSATGNPDAYVDIKTYDENNISSIDHSSKALQLFLPDTNFAGQTWKIRGANLCGWESGLVPELDKWEVAIDPDVGRIVIRVDNEVQQDSIVDHLFIDYTYGAVGPVGAHPVSYDDNPTEWNGETTVIKQVNYHNDPNSLSLALAGIHTSTKPIVIEINDSMIHELNIPPIKLNKSLIIRATDGQRPIIRLTKPLKFSPIILADSNSTRDAEIKNNISKLDVVLEGLYITRAETFTDDALISQAAVNSLQIKSCTLDPQNYRKINPATPRNTAQVSLKLDESRGFTDPADEDEFKETPEIKLEKTISGPLLIDNNYSLSLIESIIDAGSGTKTSALNAKIAVSSSNPLPDPPRPLTLADPFGPPTSVDGVTVFGKMRIEKIIDVEKIIDGKKIIDVTKGGIWVHQLKVQNNQESCIKFSYFSGNGDRLPQAHACVTGPTARLRFVSEVFENPSYGLLSFSSDFQIKERGPNDDAMGSFGFLLEYHKWRNLQTRFREFMPVNTIPLLIPVT